MRPIRPILFALCTALTLLPAVPSFAQYGGPTGAGDQDQQDEAKKKKREEAFGNLNAPLPQLRNAGPCPYVKVLYDAARYVEFKGGDEASSAVGFTGEIENIASACAYKGAEPIRLRMQVLFELGRGPEAQGARKTYQYWVAVTDRNNAVLNKEFFALPVTFPAGQDRVTLTQPLGDITIPRANSKVSGSNFEVLVGFEVTPAMADFNRQGKRFRPNAGQIPARAAAARP
ncbi:MAG: Tat pathway signal sequence domain protein [Pseudomonadota bacterium]|nr:Tat pathway signal sequence domain protein [Pseudomonadota bacterium]